MTPLPGLKRFRDLAALSQQDLAEKAGIARSTVVDIEAGVTAARPSTTRKLCVALNCEPRDLQTVPE